MCGIVAVLDHPGAAASASPRGLDESLAEAFAALPTADSPTATWAQRIGESAERLAAVDRRLRGRGGVRLLVEDEDLRHRLASGARRVEERLAALETALDRGAAGLSAARLEELNAALVRGRDLVWALSRDRLGCAERIRALSKGRGPESLVDGFAAIERVLAALDRLEVRGRDSAGVHLLLERAAELPGELSGLFGQRSADPLFASGAIRRLDGGLLSLVYKAAAEIGELGDNGRRLRRAIAEDAVLHAALQNPDSAVTVLGHTRWASVGLISEANAHPLNQEEAGKPGAPYVVAALNGDIDNYVELTKSEELRLPAEITTDAKLIPVLVSRRLAEGHSPEESFRRTVRSFSGSVAIAAQCACDPDRLYLALHGSGQALYVGLAEGTFVVASEPYGLVEQTATYLRLDGETPGNAASPLASRGQIVVLDRRRAGTLAGIHRTAYDGTPLPVAADELQQAEITTRDIDRGEHPHYLLKEICQAPGSFRKTLRGKTSGEGRGPAVELDASVLPEPLRRRLREGAVRRIVVIGQGTAAVAGQAVADALVDVLPADRVLVEAMPATELSGFRLRSDMSDTLVVAISQSGTTTDTNRTVDLVRRRGAVVVAVVNRRASDLVEKSDGVLYTSDGRDVEMSVASTKAFYSQVAAGFLLAFGLREVLTGELSSGDRELLEGLRRLPSLMEQILESRPAVARCARTHAPRRRHWAVVGNGWNRTAAQEIRIKLSELCYKSIACDATEDKKHIDLSSEPLILVCAAGLSGSTLSDVAKEVGIYAAHKAAVVVIASEGSQGFEGVEDVLFVPRCHPRLAFVLATMVGHLFGYEAAIAIDRLALPLREIRGEIEALALEAQPGENLLDTLAPRIEEASRRFYEGLGSGLYNGQLEASTAVRLASLLRYVGGLAPLESYAVEHGRAGTPSAVIEDLMVALTRGVEELTRPVDAIKHQAKTVTVGISRADEALLHVPLVRSAMEAGLDRNRLSYRDLRTLAGLDPAVREVTGFTRYRIREGARREPAAIEVVEQGGMAKEIPSRTRSNPELRGTKHLVASERRLMVARGRSDDRTVVLIPEVERGSVRGLLLLHVDFHRTRSAAAMRGVLDAYRHRYTALRDAVMETEPEFREDLLAEVPVADLLTRPVHDLAARWQSEARVASD